MNLMGTKFPNYKIREIRDLKEMLNTSVDLFHNRVAYLVKHKKGEDYTEIRYSQVLEDVNALGTKLLDLGLKGSNIAIIGENSYEWSISYLAVVNGVGTAVPLDKELPVDELMNLIKTAGVKCIIYSNTYSHYFESSDIQSKINMNFSNTDQLSLSKLISEGKSLISNGSYAYMDIKIDPDEMKILLFTSGTTDTAKGVMLCHRNIVSDIMSTCRIVAVYPSDRLLSILPIHHTFECSLGILLPLYAGASVAFCEGLKYIPKNLAEAKTTILLGVPLIFESIYDKIWKQAEKSGKAKTLKKAVNFNDFMKKFGIDLSRKLFKDIHAKFGGKLRLLVSGAAGINPTVCKGFEDFGLAIVQGYGLTECSPLVTGTPYTFRKAGTVGFAIPNVEIRLIDQNEDGIGEILCKGPNLMLGYYDDLERTDSVIKDGWFYTGDLGYLDEDGCLIITGRKKNVIVTKNGKNVYPEEVEFYLNRHDYIQESLVSGMIDNKTGETLVSAQVRPAYDIIYEEFGKDVPTERIYELLKNVIWEFNEKMPIYKRIRNFTIKNEEFIKTTTNKIKRHINQR